MVAKWNATIKNLLVTWSAWLQIQERMGGVDAARAVSSPESTDGQHVAEQQQRIQQVNLFCAPKICSISVLACTWCALLFLNGQCLLGEGEV